MAKEVTAFKADDGKVYPTFVQATDADIRYWMSIIGTNDRKHELCAIQKMNHEHSAWINTSIAFKELHKLFS